MKAVLLAFVAVALLTTAACSGSDDKTELRAEVAALQTEVAKATNGKQSADDVVVGVDRECAIGKNLGDRRALKGSLCAQFPVQRPGTAGPDGTFMLEHSLVVTVRSGNGSAYTVSYPWDSTVKVGDPWPPK